MPENEKPRIETYYTVTEIAKLWKVSDDTVRTLFVDEHGVLKIGGPSRLLGRKYKRRYYLLRIPESALRRVEQRLMDKRPAEPVSRRVLDRGSRDLHAS
jgi:hypothetical protein